MKSNKILNQYILRTQHNFYIPYINTNKIIINQLKFQKSNQAKIVLRLVLFCVRLDHEFHTPIVTLT